MPQNIIVDTSCLIVLEEIDKLDILQKLFGSVIITPTIADEFGATLPAWIKRKEIENRKYQELLETMVDPGEASAIALSVQIDGLLILDDLKARKLASELNLDYTGTLGILIEAKRNGYVSSFKEILDQIKQTNFYLSDHLLNKLLKIIDE